MSAFHIPNGDATVKPSAATNTGRFASVYSEVQTSRLNHSLPLPSVLKKPFKIVDGPPSSAAGNPGLFLIFYDCLYLVMLYYDRDY